MSELSAEDIEAGRIHGGFSDENCDRILKLVMDHKNAWSFRLTNGYGSLYTLGATSAFNSKQGDGNLKDYQTMLSLSNPLLSEHLHEEYEQIRKWVETTSSRGYGTQMEVSYDDRLALPGFQIFVNIKSGGDRRKNGGYIHQDYLWNERDIKDIINIPRVDDEYSATIMLSKGSYSLDIWDNYPDGLRKLEYKRGVPTMHSHQLFHQVPYEGKEGDIRVSMQIRAFRIGNKITIYF
jgi:hypothetical protein